MKIYFIKQPINYPIIIIKYIFSKYNILDINRFLKIIIFFSIFYIFIFYI